MIPPNDVVEALWRWLFEAPSTWGRETGADAHPLVDGLFSALGTVAAPLGALCTLFLIASVLPLYAIAYDTLAVATRPLRARR